MCSRHCAGRDQVDLPTARHYGDPEEGNFVRAKLGAAAALGDQRSTVAHSDSSSTVEHSDRGSIP